MASEKIDIPPIDEAEPCQLLCYYDQDCGICQAIIHFFQVHGGEDKVTFIGNTKLDKHTEEIPEDLLERTIVVINPQTGQRYIESRAIALMLAQLPRPWRWMRWISLPGLRWCSDRVYRAVARHRLKLSRLLGLNACASRSIQDQSTQKRNQQSK